MKNPNQKIKVVLSASNHRLGHALIHSIVQSKSFTLLFIAKHESEFLDWLKKSGEKPDILVLGFEKRDWFNSETYKLFQKIFHQSKIILIGEPIDHETIKQVIKKGISAYLSPDCLVEDLCKAMLAVHNHGVYFNQFINAELISKIIQEREWEKQIAIKFGISPREAEYLNYMSRHKTNIKIAELMCVSSNTAKTYRKRIMEKMSVKKATEIISLVLSFQAE